MSIAFEPLFMRFISIIEDWKVSVLDALPRWGGNLLDPRFLSGMFEDERFDEGASSNFSFSGKFNVGGWSHGPILHPNWRKFRATQAGRINHGHQLFSSTLPVGGCSRMSQATQFLAQLGEGTQCGPSQFASEYKSLKPCSD